VNIRQGEIWEVIRRDEVVTVLVVSSDGWTSREEVDPICVQVRRRRGVPEYRPYFLATHDADQIGDAIIDLTTLTKTAIESFHKPVTTISGVTMAAVQDALRDMFELRQPRRRKVE